MRGSHWACQADDSFLAKDPGFLTDKANKLRFWQALRIEVRDRFDILTAARTLRSHSKIPQ
jgi:hypothetical protein